MSKYFVFKIYENDGTLVKILPIQIPLIPSENSNLILNTPRIKSEINGGQGELTIELDATIDDFNEGTIVAHNNIIKMYLIDTENYPTGKIMYTGVIVTYEPTIRIDRQFVKIIAVSRITELSQGFYKQTGSLDFTMTTISASELFQHIIDDFRGVYSNSDINYSTSSVETTAVDVSYNFQNKTWRDSVNAVLDLAPEGYWYRVDPDGTAHFKSKPSSSTHQFKLQNHIDEIRINKTMEPVKNTIFLQWGDGPTLSSSSNTTSIATHGTREAFLSATEIKDSTTSVERMDNFLNKNSSIKRRITMIVNDSYVSRDGTKRIEDIMAGETCDVVGQSKDSTLLVENMQIVKVDYDGTTATLILEEDYENLVTQINA